MGLKSLERVKAALHFTGPDKVPVWKIGSGDVFGMAMVPSEKWKPGHSEDEQGLFPHAFDDIVVQSGLWKWEKPNWANSNPKYAGLDWLNVKREEIDIWGNIWIRRGDGSSMGHPGRSSLTDWNNLDKFLEKYTPDPYDKSQYSVYFIDGAKTSAKNKYRTAMLGFLGPFQIAANARGFTNFLIDHKRNPEHVKHILAHYTEWYIKSMDAWIKYGADPHAFLLVEDLGSQEGPFVSPKMFDKFYKSVYGEIYKAAHDKNREIFQHCCGKIDPILPYLIEWGLDSIELDAPRMTGYPALRTFRGKILYWGCVNIQSIYPRGTPEECEREVWHMIRNLGTPDGGFGAYFYPSPHHIKVPQENVNSFNNGIKKYGIYNKIPSQWWEYPTPEIWNDVIVPPLPPV
jgi:hypothetical protein